MNISDNVSYRILMGVTIHTTCLLKRLLATSTVSYGRNSVIQMRLIVPMT